MQCIGRRIYYDKITGQILLDTGEKEGSIEMSSIEDDFLYQPMLENRTLEDTDLLEFEYGEKCCEDILDIGNMIVDINTKMLIMIPETE